MNIQQAIDKTNTVFVYQTDRSYYLFPEAWRVVGDDGVGDCEDYALTVIWYYSDGNWLRWWKNVQLGRFRFWYCNSPGGNKHVVTKIVWGDNAGMYFDNISKQLLTQQQLDRRGYKLYFPWFFPFPTVQIVLGYTLGSIGKFIRKKTKKSVR